MSRLSARQHPHVYAALLAHREDELRALQRQALNPYVRPSLQAAWTTGWWAWTHRARLGDDWTSPLLTPLANAALRRGWVTRAGVEAVNQHTGGQHGPADQ